MTKLTDIPGWERFFLQEKLTFLSRPIQERFFLQEKLTFPSRPIQERFFLQEKLKCFYSIHVSQLILYHPSFEQSHQCRRPPPRRNTAPTISVLGTHTRKSRHPIFIPSNITTPTAKNMPNYTKTTSWSSANMSPKSPDGIAAPVGLPRIVPIPMDTWMFAPGRNTHFMARTHFSRISAAEHYLSKM